MPWLSNPAPAKKEAPAPDAIDRMLGVVAARFHADPLDFQPGLIRLQQKAPSPLGRKVLWVLLIFLAVLLAGSLVGRIDIVAVAEGKLIPSTYLKIVQPTDAGVVKDILVKEGEAVKAGQVLMRMDAALSNSDLKTLNAEYWARRLALKRIDAQLNGTPLTRTTDEPADLFARVQAQYTANKTAYESAIAQEQATLQKAKYDLGSAQEVRSKLLQTLPHYRDQEAAYEKLTRDGFAGKIMYTDKQRERIEKEQDLKAQESAILSSRSTIAQSEKKIAQISADYQKQLQAERADNVPQLEKASQELAKQQHRHEYLELKAPQDGFVKDLATHTIGTVASPGTILMTLVPRDEILKAEVWVKNDDVGFVRPDLPVKLKLSAFTFQKYGMVQGQVFQVSADATEQGADQNSGTTPNKGKPNAPLAYKTVINLKSQSLDAEGIKYPLSPGMQVSAEIHLGTRTVMEYFLSPVTKAFHEAGRER